MLSTIVTTISLGLAFSHSARALVFGTCRQVFGYLTRPVKGNKLDRGNLAAASPRAIRDFMIAKQKEWDWETTNHGNGITSGALPLHRKGEKGRAPTGLKRLFWRRESA